MWPSGLQAKIWREILLVTWRLWKEESKSLHQPECPHRVAKLRNDRHTSFYCFTILCSAAVAVSINGRFVTAVKGASHKEPFFPTAFAHLLSQCHTLVILTIFQTFSLWSVVMVICDQGVIFEVTITKKTTTFYRFRWWLAIFSNQLILIKVYILLF